jgi:excisionase family DNA binding protein
MKMVRTARVESESDDLSEDLLDGADEIAEFTGWSRRRVFYLLEKGLIPAFKVGKRWTARKSRLKRHFEKLEGPA